MTKERFIQLLEQQFNEKKNEWNADEEMSEVSQDIFNTVETYIEVLRKSDESYDVLQSATVAFYGLLNNRLSKKINEGLEGTETLDVTDIDLAINGINNTLCNIEMMRLTIAISSIFFNVDVVLEICKEVKEKMDAVLLKEGEIGVEKTIEAAAEDIAKQEYYDEFSCTREDIDNLEKIIGPQQDFDYVTGRSIMFTKYESR